MSYVASYVFCNCCNGAFSPRRENVRSAGGVSHLAVFGSVSNIEFPLSSIFARRRYLGFDFCLGLDSYSRP